MISRPAEPSFIDYSFRRLFVVKYHSSPGIEFKGAVLHLPAFGEEMNKSRAIIAAQARELAGKGYDVLVPDYYGTGDSGGDFAEASWTLWLEDMRYCLRRLQEESSGPTLLWGLRLGSLMAIELASEPELGVSKLLLWNPVLAGEQHMLQFLRLRLANIMISGGAKEKISDLKKRLEDEGILEVSGYELSNALFTEVCSRKAKQYSLTTIKQIYWAEVAVTEKTRPLPVQQQFELWQADGVNVQLQSVIGYQFWATQEISQAPQLIVTTNRWLGEESTQSNTPQPVTS